jgi:general transcription factor 3C polypeptide 5 (transcription factor C subunit 1)
MSRAKRPLDQPVLSSSDPIDVETEPAQTYKPAESFPFPRDAAFVSVEYPGYVADIDKVFETLGGRERVGKVSLKNMVWDPDAFLSQTRSSQVTSDASTFLELRYRPSDPFSHPIVGDAIDTSNLLLKITRKRRKAKDGRPAGPWEEKQEILGEIVRTVRFRGWLLPGLSKGQS